VIDVDTTIKSCSLVMVVTGSISMPISYTPTFDNPKRGMRNRPKVPIRYSLFQLRDLGERCKLKRCRTHKFTTYDMH